MITPKRSHKVLSTDDLHFVSLCCDCLLATEICCDIITSLLQRFYDTIPFSKASKRWSLTELQKATI